MRFEGKVAIVTGAGRGVGRAAARRLATEGATVVVADTDQDTIASTTAEITAMLAVLGAAGRGVAVGGRADVTSESEIDALVDRVMVEHGGVDILVTTASDGRPGAEWASVADTALASWNEFIARHLTSAFLTARAVLPAMVDQGRGHIVCVGSIAAANGQAGGAAYAAANAGLEALVASIAKEVGADGVSCNGVIAGNVAWPAGSTSGAGSASGFVERDPEHPDLDSAVHLGRAGTPEELAGAIAFLCSEDASYLSGAMIPVDGGFHRSNLL